MTASLLDQLPGAKRLADWLQRALVGLGEMTGGLALYIKDQGEQARREKVLDYAIDAGKIADRLALEIMHDAQEQADGTGSGVHKFVVYAIRGHETTPFQSYGFMVASQSSADSDASEVTNEKALLADGRRHIEATQKIMANMLGQVQANNQMTIDSLLEQNRMLIAREMESQRMAYQNTMDRAAFTYDQKTQDFFHEAARGFGQIAGPILIPKMLAKLTGEDAEKPKAAAPAVEVLEIPETVLPPKAPQIVTVRVVNRKKRARRRQRDERV